MADLDMTDLSFLTTDFEKKTGGLDTDSTFYKKIGELILWSNVLLLMSVTMTIMFIILSFYRLTNTTLRQIYRMVFSKELVHLILHFVLLFIISWPYHLWPSSIRNFFIFEYDTGFICCLIFFYYHQYIIKIYGYSNNLRLFNDVAIFLLFLVNTQVQKDYKIGVFAVLILIRILVLPYKQYSLDNHLKTHILNPWTLVKIILITDLINIFYLYLNFETDKINILSSCIKNFCNNRVDRGFNIQLYGNGVQIVAKLLCFCAVFTLANKDYLKSRFVGSYSYQYYYFNQLIYAFELFHTWILAYTFNIYSQKIFCTIFFYLWVFKIQYDFLRKFRNGPGSLYLFVFICNIYLARKILPYIY